MTSEVEESCQINQKQATDLFRLINAQQLAPKLAAAITKLDGRNEIRSRLQPPATSRRVTKYWHSTPHVVLKLKSGDRHAALSSSAFSEINSRA
jgi:hypothetical protein